MLTGERPSIKHLRPLIVLSLENHLHRLLCAPRGQFQHHAEETQIERVRASPLPYIRFRTLPAFISRIDALDVEDECDNACGGGWRRELDTVRPIRPRTKRTRSFFVPG